MHTLFVHLWCRSISLSKSYYNSVASCIAFTVFRACRGSPFRTPLCALVGHLPCSRASLL
jgi:hypothetical protein